MNRTLRLELECEPPALRAYQREAIGELREAVAAGRRRIVLVAPTGAGKTVIASELIRGAAAKGSRTLFLAHRRELIRQCSAKLLSFGVEHGVIAAGEPALETRAVQVASVQTLYERALRRRRVVLPVADLVVVDECHRARAQSYRRILSAYPRAVVLGLTATPCRSDGRGLGELFEAMVECPPVRSLVELGHLVHTRVYAPARPDLRGVRVRGGDYVERELARRMDAPGLVGDVVAHWLRLGGRRKTVVFASGVRHSLHLRDEFRRAGVRCEHIDGGTPREARDAVLERLSRGEVEVVTNAMVLTEGWDQPDVGCVVLARPTKHMGLYRQMVGRVLRSAPGKNDAIVLDHAGTVFEHGFVEEPIAWTLDPDRRAENPVHARGGASRGEPGEEPAITICAACGAAYRRCAQCPGCGHRPQPRPREVAVAEGELSRVRRSGRRGAERASWPERCRWWGMLSWMAGRHGYREGWVAHTYRKRFGVWPRGVRERPEAQPRPPDEEVRRFVRHLQIRFAKRKSA